VKALHVHEKYRVQVRAEALNAFNRSTLGGIVTDVTNPQFGQVTGITWSGADLPGRVEQP